MLSKKQQAFVDAYSGNSTEAARAAGWTGSRQTIANRGAECLKNPEIVEAIKSRLPAGFAKNAVRAANGDIAAAVKLNAIASREERQAFWTAAMRGQIEGVDPLRASELLGKSCGDFIDKVEHSGNVSIAVVDPYAVKREIEVEAPTPRLSEEN